MLINDPSTDSEVITETSKTDGALTPCQQKALKQLESPHNVFLTGVAGSGKSYLLQHFLAKKDRKSHPIVASTGAAAILVKGITFHSFFGLGIMEGGLDRTVERASRDKRLIKRLKRAETVIIDEISMIPGQALQAAESVSRLARDRDLPWGGLKIIAVGDFGQLPPVNTHGQKKDWAFLSPAWRESDFQVAYLQTVMRVQDVEFLKVLDLVREGHVSPLVNDFLNSRRMDPGPDFTGTRLFPHRQSVEDYNLKKLEVLSGSAVAFETQYHATKNNLDTIKKTAPLPEVLWLKIGALVMIRKNDPALSFVNGSLGLIQEIRDEELDIELLNGRAITLTKETFSCLNAEGEEVAWATNFPVNLAWASTIHKSQGMTLDSAIMDLSKVFEAGQAYVALSRVRSSDGLFLSDWSPRTIRAAPEVQAFHEKIKHARQS